MIGKLLVLGRNDRLTNIVRTQKIHLQDAPPTAIQPETTGPRAGPAKGDTAKRSIAFPRVFASHMSPTTPLVKKQFKENMPLCVGTTYPLFVKGAAAKVPAKNRKIKMEAVFCDRAQPT
jgi:hypothetical protein